MFIIIDAVIAILVFGAMLVCYVMSLLAKTRRAAIIWKVLAVAPFTCACVTLMALYACAREYVVAFIIIPLVWAAVIFSPKIIVRICGVLAPPPPEE